jgi:hypothetical protein
MTRVFCCSVFFYILILLASCSGGGSGDSGSDNTQLSGNCALRTVGGETCSNGAGPVAFITGVIDGEFTGICSGVFISQSKILTAAHCTELTGTLVAYISDRQIPITNILVYPGFLINSSPGYNDVMILTVPDQADVSPLPLLLSESISPGNAFAIYGYGPDPADDSFSSTEPPSLGRADLSIDELEPGPEPHLFTAIRQDNGSGGCAGDSGGPAIAKNKDGLFGIIGLVEAGSNNTCEPGTINIFTNIQNSDITSFILRAVPEAGVI